MCTQERPQDDNGPIFEKCGRPGDVIGPGSEVNYLMEVDGAGPAYASAWRTSPTLTDHPRADQTRAGNERPTITLICSKRARHPTEGADAKVGRARGHRPVALVKIDSSGAQWQRIRVYWPMRSIQISIGAARWPVGSCLLTRGPFRRRAPACRGAILRTWPVAGGKHSGAGQQPGRGAHADKWSKSCGWARSRAAAVGGPAGRAPRSPGPFWGPANGSHGQTVPTDRDSSVGPVICFEPIRHKNHDYYLPELA